MHDAKDSMLYKVLFCTSFIGLGLGLIVHVAAFCGHSVLPPFPWRQIVSVIGAIIFVLSIWRRVDTLKQWGSGLIGHVCGILMLQGVAYAVVDPFIRVTSLDAGQKGVSRPVLVALFSMTANEYDLFRARTFSAVVMFIFFITFAQALTILRNSRTLSLRGK